MKKASPNTYFKKRVGEYELSEVLGEGSFATVRRARHVKSGQEFAVKCLDKSQVEKQHMESPRLYCLPCECCMCSI